MCSLRPRKANRIQQNCRKTLLLVIMWITVIIKVIIIVKDSIIYNISNNYDDIKCYFSLNKFTLIFPISINSSYLIRRRSKLNSFFRGHTRVIAETKYSEILGTVNTKNYSSTLCTPCIHPPIYYRSLGCRIVFFYYFY